MTGKAWEQYRKALPKNYAQQVQKALCAKGFSYSIQQIKDIRRMRITDPEKQAQIWSAIRKLRKTHATKRKHLTLLKSLRS